MGIIDEKDLEAVSPLFRGETGHHFAGFLMHLFSFDRVNQLYDNSSQYTGAAFAANILKDLKVNYVVGNAGRLRQLPEGAFITISNHPYGGLDGVIMIDMMASIRKDYKFMVNRILSMVKAMNDNFISVTPTGNKKAKITAASINGVRQTLKWLQEGHPVGFFPSGAVSDFSLLTLKVRDRRWQPGILHLICQAKVPILPIRFFDGNSAFFYSLGLINWRVRILRQPSEIFNKAGKKHRLAIGNLISVEEQKQFSDFTSLGAFLRKAVYEMPLPSSFTPREDLFFMDGVSARQPG
ncbi:MAG TPA: 1-acyl-sn-glycerol-3-phosphate acyltransferase [Bacteroidales bacterium]|nr:1-acyl-sn-glycerol-3-phosphate acyltransferase [Bacteroidales bacterium]